MREFKWYDVKTLHNGNFAHCRRGYESFVIEIQIKGKLREKMLIAKSEDGKTVRVSGDYLFDAPIAILEEGIDL